jgi:hypothetical protein
LKNTIIIAVLVLIVAGAGGFIVGMKYQQSKQPTFSRQFNGQINGQQGQRVGIGQNGQNRMGFQPVNGEIINSDASSITVKLQDGSSKIVLYSDKTLINKSSSGATADLKVGEKVAVFGQTNTDGSVTAQSIQLNPVLRVIPSQPPQ